MVVVFFAITSTILVGAFFSASLAKVSHVEGQVSETAAFNAAESGLNAVIEQVWTSYREASPSNRLAILDKLDGKYSPDDKLLLSGLKMGRSAYSAEVSKVRVEGSDYADVEFTASAENEKATRYLTTVVRYGRKPSQVFDHAYFINNFGWLWGSGITVNGDVRSNGNFSLKSARVNGDIYASENPEIDASGTVEGSSYHDDISDYWDRDVSTARPSSPSAPSEDTNGNGVLDAGEDANGNGTLDLYEYKDGYDGESERYEKQEVIEMPYLGDLTVYRDLANSKGGKIYHGGQLLVEGVLGDAPSEEKSIMLIGTPEDPIVIDGPVVIESDVVLKGVITGRGTIYAGRNVHIIGNLTYLNPPEWPKPMTDAAAVKAANQAKDLVGLAAKGSILMGDYTTSSWKSGVSNYQKPPFTQAYEVDPSDSVNGYVSYTDSEGRTMFNGNYTAYDGGEKDDGEGGTEPRRFYESSFSDDLVHEKADSDSVTQIDAVLYTNHLLSGRVGACTWNGTLVSRDEAILYSGTATMNYDTRVKGNGYEHIDIFLPRGPAYRVLYWREGRSAATAEEEEAVE